ncbi:MAG: hypothetical protein AUJ85_09665 [Elusimicrobia bacterium CG1_02_37_114]|nr:MAG: hypothetical protein AUJ85_09665 [Elusimicrobia bacterium CG1_02_37_114]
MEIKKLQQLVKQRNYYFYKHALNYRLADCRVIVKNVPALVCHSCGQEYIAPSVAKYVNELVNNIRENSKIFSRRLHLQQICPKEVAVTM